MHPVSLLNLAKTFVFLNLRVDRLDFFIRSYRMQKLSHSDNDWLLVFEIWERRIGTTTLCVQLFQFLIFSFWEKCSFLFFRFLHFQSTRGFKTYKHGQLGQVKFLGLLSFQDVSYDAIAEPCLTVKLDILQHPKQSLWFWELYTRRNSNLIYYWVSSVKKCFFYLLFPTNARRKLSRW